MKAKMMSVKNWFVSKKKFFNEVVENYIIPFLKGVWVGCAIWGALFIITAKVTGKVWTLVDREK